MSDQLHQSPGMATWRLSPNTRNSRNWPSSCRCRVVALSISSTDECLLYGKRNEHQWVRQSGHELVSSSGTVDFAHRSPPPDSSLVDWRSPNGKKSSYFSGLVSRLLHRMETTRASSLPAAAVDAPGGHDLPNPQHSISRAMPFLPGETGSDCLSQSAVRRVYQMCCMAWHRRRYFFRRTIRQ